MIASGRRLCLTVVVWSATKDAVKKMLPGYGGTVGRDSNPIWLHTGGDRQFCESHQHHLSKKDIKHINPKGDVLRFLTALHHLDYKHYVYDRIDPRTKVVATKCLEKERSELLHGIYRDDKRRTVARCRKRHRRRGSS